MSSPVPRQIGGMGSADPLTSTVAPVGRSKRADGDIDYPFLQVFGDCAVISDGQNCSDIFASVARFAIERGVVMARDGETPITIHIEKSGQIAEVRVQPLTAGSAMRASHGLTASFARPRS